MSDLISFIASDPMKNVPKIWTEYLPNDPFCQQTIKQGRNYLLSQTARCNDCQDCKIQERDGSNSSPPLIMLNNKACVVKRFYRTKPKYKYYGSTKGRLDKLLQQVGDIYLLCCPESESDHHYIGFDDYTVTTLGNLMLEKLIPKYSRSIERVFRCQDRLTIIQPVIRELIDTNLYKQGFRQIQDIIAKLSEVRYNLGSITYKTLLHTTDGLIIDLPKNCSFDLNDQYRIGPILDDYSIPTLDVFEIQRYKGSKRHYFRLMTSYEDGVYSDSYIHAISKYGIPVVGRSLDIYRLTCALILRYINDLQTITSTSWFKELFLPSEHTRLVKRLKIIHSYLDQNPSAQESLDLIHCLYDREGPFALRCDAHLVK
jgi:hypothetical protein